jgi:hypothetical protein
VQIYGAVLASDAEASIRKVERPILALCARDDVLSKHLKTMKRAKEGNAMVETGVIGGAGFSADRDIVGLLRYWEPFLENCQ